MERLLLALSAVDTCLTLDQLETTTGLTYRQVCLQLRRTVRAGWVSRADKGCYCLTPSGRDATARGAALPADIVPLASSPRRTNDQQTRIWSAMRSLRKFCLADLMELVTVDGEDTARVKHSFSAYITQLSQAGYLVRLDGTVRVSATARGQTRWRLAWDTGPEAPRPKHETGRYVVLDFNRGRIYSRSEPVGPA